MGDGLVLVWSAVLCGRLTLGVCVLYVFFLVTSFNSSPTSLSIFIAPRRFMGLFPGPIFGRRLGVTWSLCGPVN